MFGAGIIAYVLFIQYISNSVRSPYKDTKKHSYNSCAHIMIILNVFTDCVFIAEGRLEITKDGLKVFTVEPEDMFGEVALLYSCTHTYSVTGIKALCQLLGLY